MKRHYIWQALDLVRSITGNIFPFAIKEYKNMLEWEIEFLNEDEKVLHSQLIKALNKKLK